MTGKTKLKNIMKKVIDRKEGRTYLDFSNESFAKSKFPFALIIEEKHTVWYNNMD